MNKVIIICFLLLAMLTGCRHEDDVQEYFYTHQYKFDALVKASLSNKGSTEKEALMKELDVWGVDLERSHCDTVNDYGQVRMQMEHGVYVDGTPWKCSYYFIYEVCPRDSFYSTSNHMISGWLTPQWCYFIDKGNF